MNNLAYQGWRPPRSCEPTRLSPLFQQHGQYGKQVGGRTKGLSQRVVTFHNAISLLCLEAKTADGLSVCLPYLRRVPRIRNTTGHAEVSFCVMHSWQSVCLHGPSQRIPYDAHPHMRQSHHQSNQPLHTRLHLPTGPTSRQTLPVRPHNSF